MYYLLALLSVLSCFFMQALGPQDWDILKQYADKNLMEKLEKIQSTNFTEYYQKEFVDKGFLLWEKVDNHLAKKVEESRKEFIDALNLSSEQKEEIIKIRAPKEQVIKPTINSTEITSLDMSVQNSLIKYARKFEAPIPAYIDAAHAEGWQVLLGGFQAPYANVREKDGKYYNIVGYDKEWFHKKSAAFADYIMAHELMHIKFNHIYPQSIYKSCTPKSAAFSKKLTHGFYKELQADMYPVVRSLKIARQCELMYAAQMKKLIGENTEDDNIHNLYNNAPALVEDVVGNNHPVRGKQNNDSHPTDLYRYIKALKMRKTLEAERAWFKTNEADERYGNQYYDQAFQKWSEQQSSNQ